jgi:hypothetical protein
LARKSAAVDQDSARSYYIMLGWLSALYSQLMYGGLNFVAAYKIVVSQNSAEPQAQYSWSSVPITCLMVTVFSLKQWNLPE